MSVTGNGLLYFDVSILSVSRFSHHRVTSMDVEMCLPTILPNELIVDSFVLFWACAFCDHYRVFAARQSTFAFDLCISQRDMFCT